MPDQDKPRILAVPGHGELTQEEQEQIADFIGWALARDNQSALRTCNKPCIANVNGHCAVKVCGGPITRITQNKYQDLETAARFYSFAKAAFDDYFREGYIDDDTEE